MPASKIRERVCQECGTPYTLGSESTLHKYCSVSCRSKFHNKNGGKKYRNSIKGKAASRKWRLKNVFNITEEVFEELFDSQNRSCAICGTETPTGYNWHIDHCHATGKVRGILCSKCNQGIGLLGDTAERVKKAYEYLQQFS